MKNINIVRVVLLLLTTSLLISCDEGGDPDPGVTTTVALAGDWWVVALNPDGQATAFGGDYVNFSTYNTSANDNSFWLDDNNNWMQIKSKATANLDALTFSGEANAPELYAPATVTVTNGAFTKGTYTTASGTKVDGISFDAEFSWDAGNVYKFVGHFRTGFLEDENPHYQP